jgi:16S rRNA (cytosine967-C5)-methyltransferase
VLDACAAPGGKTLAIAERLGAGRPIVAFDRNRAGLAGSCARRRGSASRPWSPRPTRADRRRAHVRRRPARRALLRARHAAAHPEIKWRRRPEDVARLAALQRELVDGRRPLVKPGGLLVYAVCTRTRTRRRRRRRAPGGASEVRRRTARGPCVDADGFLRTAPHRHGLDGFFAARLRARA